VLTPPDVLTMTGLALPLVLLYEISIFSARLVEPKHVEA
jgi:sec-independent protein translocase protein TatC